MRTLTLLLALLWAAPASAQPYAPGSARWYAPYPVQIVPPTLYRTLWVQAAACTEVVPVAPFERVTFLAVPFIVDMAEPRNVVVGLATPEQGTIRLAWPGVVNPSVVLHEMLHLFLPDAEHDAPEFRQCDPIAR